ncbi:MAG: DUF4288 domain-containing protein [Bacteriovoracia bacterium]
MAKKVTKKKSPKASGGRWFAVRTFYEISTSGPGKKMRGLEELVHVFKVKSLVAAIDRALAQAVKYEKSKYQNQQGEDVTARFLGKYDAVEITGPLKDGSLAFGLLDVFASSKKLEKSLRYRHTSAEDKNIKVMSKKFAPKGFKAK